MGVPALLSVCAACSVSKGAPKVAATCCMRSLSRGVSILHRARVRSTPELRLAAKHADAILPFIMLHTVIEHGAAYKLRNLRSWLHLPIEAHHFQQRIIDDAFVPTEQEAKEDKAIG